MDFNDLIADFGTRHKVENLVAVDNAAALDIDGIIVTIVANGEEVTMSAEIGEPPAEGVAAFSNLLLEANLLSGVFFAKAPERGPYIAVQRLSLQLIDGASFDVTLEAFVNQAETWRRLLTDFRPLAEASTERAQQETASFGTSDFMQV